MDGEFELAAMGYMFLRWWCDGLELRVIEIGWNSLSGLHDMRIERIRELTGRHASRVFGSKGVAKQSQTARRVTYDSQAFISHGGLQSTAGCNSRPATGGQWAARQVSLVCSGCAYD